MKESSPVSIGLFTSELYAEKAIAFGRKHHYKNVEATGLILTAATKFKPNSKEYIEYRVKALELWKKSGNYYGMSWTYSHLYYHYYDKKQTVTVKNNSINVTLPKTGGSFRVVAKTDSANSLPSEPAVFSEPKSLSIPGRINMFDTTTLENAHLRYREAKGDKPELYYLLKFTGPEQIVAKAEFNISVQKSAWYTLNYNGKMGGKGEFFQLWRANKLIGKVNYDKNIDDKTSNRHKVFLEQGAYTLQLSVVRDTPDRWHMNWIELTEAKG